MGRPDRVLPLLLADRGEQPFEVCGQPPVRVPHSWFRETTGYEPNRLRDTTGYEPNRRETTGYGSFALHAPIQSTHTCKAGSYLSLIDSCITQLKAQGPPRTCNESKEPCGFRTPGLGFRVEREERTGDEPLRERESDNRSRETTGYEPSTPPYSRRSGSAHLRGGLVSEAHRLLYHAA